MSCLLMFLLVCVCSASLRSGDPLSAAIWVCKDGLDVSDVGPGKTLLGDSLHFWTPGFLCDTSGLSSKVLLCTLVSRVPG